MLTPGIPNCSQVSDMLVFDLTPMRQATMLVWLVGMPVIMVLGTFGNIMILLIQRREYSSSHSSMSILFTCLAISDLTSLWFDPLFWWLEALDVFIYYSFLWKIRMFVIYLTGHTSASILVTMTTQKAVSILWPHRVKVMFTARIAKNLMCGGLVFFLLINSHLLYGVTVILPTNTSTPRCFDMYVSSEYAEFFNNVWGWVDTFFSSLVPVLLLLVANSVLIRKVGQSLQEARKRFSTGNADRLRSREKKTSSMTVTLIATSVTFLLLTSPYSVYFVFRERLFAGADKDTDIADANDLAFAVLHLLWIGNNSVTFYLYCLTGAKYRENFFKARLSEQSQEANRREIH
ncbi:uncharacterized protein LOC112571120 [Pomacea canaliculata]|uniref:uncharacterized protein LOC112571120 n=1 Tax=Pomacea canaliculata TaxID=400727 RepID=UPI000D72D134|nr:uncharacterized protein LOC112571120 [Pomacea canaliculata]